MYFNVKTSLKIAGKCYKPCISYKMNENLALTVKNLVSEGKAEVSEAPVFFQSGKKLVKKAVVKENLTTENADFTADFAKKLQKKAKKNKKTEEKAEKEAVSEALEDTSEDENGGF